MEDTITRAMLLERLGLSRLTIEKELKVLKNMGLASEDPQDVVNGCLSYNKNQWHYYFNDKYDLGKVKPLLKFAL